MKTINKSKRALMAAMKELMKVDDDDMISYDSIVYQGNGVVMVRCSCQGKEDAIFIKTDGDKAQIDEVMRI